MIKMAITLASMILLSSCTAVTKLQEPQVELKEIQLRSMDFEKAQADIMTLVTNPNHKEIHIDQMEYTVFINQKSISKNTLNEKTVLPAGKTTTVAIPFSFQFKDLSSGLGALLSKAPLKYEVLGTVKSGIFKIPFSKKGEIQY